MRRCGWLVAMSVGLTGWFGGAPLACAQQITLQQPVVEQFGVMTTVSVPDRGRASLGGIKRGASSRIRQGPLPWGTSTGWEYSGSDLSVSVWIHDFEELDRQALEWAEGRRPVDADRPLSDAQAERAWQMLAARHRAAPSYRPLDDGPSTPHRTAAARPSAARECAQKAEAAAAKGHFGLAQMHRERAKKAASRASDVSTLP